MFSLFTNMNDENKCRVARGRVPSFDLAPMQQQGLDPAPPRPDNRHANRHALAGMEIFFRLLTFQCHDAGAFSWGPK